MNRNLNSLSAALSLLLTATICRAEDWPQWRGPRYDAVSRETGLPTDWSDSQNVVWKVQLPGIGSATPVVWGNRILLTSQADDELLLLCFNTDGKEQWRHRLGQGRSRGREEENNSVSSADGKLILTAKDGTFTVVKPGETLAILAKNKLSDQFAASPAISNGRLYLRGFANLYAIGAK